MICYSLLICMKDEIHYDTPTKVMGWANLSHIHFMSLLKLMETQGLVNIIFDPKIAKGSTGRNRYRVTEKGDLYVRTFRMLIRLLGLLDVLPDYKELMS